MSKTKNQWAVAPVPVKTEDVLKNLDKLVEEAQTDTVQTNEEAVQLAEQLKEKLVNAEKEIASIQLLVKEREERLNKTGDNLVQLQSEIEQLTLELAKVRSENADLKKKLAPVERPQGDVFAPMLCGHPQACRGVRDTGEQYCRWCEDINRLTLANRRLAVESEQLTTQVTALTSSNVTSESALRRAKQTAYQVALDILKACATLDEASYVISKRLQDLIAEPMGQVRQL